MTKCSTGWVHPKTFRPDHDMFIENFNKMSVMQLKEHYSVSRDTIDKYLKKHNLKSNYYKTGEYGLNLLIEDLKKDILYNVAKKHNLTTTEILRRLKWFNVDYLSIDISDNDMKNGLTRMFAENENVQGKSVSYDKRLNEYVLKETANHKLNSDKITEKVYRIVNNYTPEQLDVCAYCNAEIPFYTFARGYGFTDIQMCRKCNATHNGRSGGRYGPSQDLFNAIVNKCTNIDINELWYASRNREYRLDIQAHERTEYTNTYYYSLDFVYKNKVIEFDGEYWHDDIHLETAKDDFIKSKGFDILHIKSKDYFADIEGTINKCIKFLEL